MTPACAALLSPLLSPALGSDLASPGCIAAGLEMAGRVEQRFPSGGIDRAFALPRARTGVGVSAQGAGARLLLGTVRSGGDDGYIGVDGEALVPRVEVADARFQAPAVGLSIAAGLVDDPWVVTGNQAWGYRPFAAEMSQDQGWNERSDLGALAAWTSPGAWVTAATTLTSGEGLARRERNGGQNLAGLVVVRPMAATAHPDGLQVTIYGRDGSRGLGLSRDHRLAGRVSGQLGPALGGVEHMRAWGVAGDAARRPTGWSAWAGTRADQPLALVARLDRIDLDPDGDDDRLHVLRAGAGARLPWRASPAPARLMAVLERTHRQPDATALAGATAEQVQGFVGLQLDVQLWGALEPAGGLSTGLPAP
jgi:hypothetical protein